MIWRSLESAAALALALMAGLVIWQVGARYVLGAPPSWTEELARYLQVWLVLLASPVCVRRGLHLAVDWVSPRFPFLRYVTTGLVGLFSLALAFYGLRLLEVAALQTSPALGVSMVWAYAAIPASGALMTLAAIEVLRS